MGAPVSLNKIVTPLLNWYDANARVLPWREKPAPYRVWVSEIMLQQTRVEAVKPYFERFVSALPNIPALAAADTDLLLKLWEGLGYYSRVRNLQKAAQIVMQQYGGELPASYEALLALPGIGAYTAGAIASIAYGIRVPAVDGNVLRVTARVLGSGEDVGKAAVKDSVRQALFAALPVRAGDFNQALMELGALVCLPGSAVRCSICPIKSVCVAFLQGTAPQLPVKAAKKPRKMEDRTVFVLICGENAAMHRRAETGLLAGMWEPPSLPGKLSRQQAEQILHLWGMNAETVKKLPDSKHVFTHIEWHMKGYLAVVDRCAGESDWTWINRQSLRKEIALPSAFHAYSNALRGNSD